MPEKTLVLHVEDDEDTRIVVEELVRQAGFAYLGAETAEAALELLTLHGGAVEVILLDLLLPTMDGFKFLRRIVNTHPYPCAVSMVTAFGTKETVEQFFRTTPDRGAGGIEAADFVMKPFNGEQLSASIRRGAELVAKKKREGTYIVQDVHSRVIRTQERTDEIHEAIASVATS